MLPLLQILADGEVHHVSELRERLAEHFEVTEADRQELLKNGARRFDHNVAWARTDLGQAGALESPRRGYVRITERGRSILEEKPSKIDRKFLRRYPEFCDFMGRRRVKETAQDGAEQHAEDLTEAVTPLADAEPELLVPSAAPAEEPGVGDQEKTVSFTDAAEQVLERYASKQPMHYRAITNRILELGLVKTQGQTPEATLYAQILTEITRRTRQGNTPRFTKHGRGLVGLSSWVSGSLADQIDQHNREARRQLLSHLGTEPPRVSWRLVLLGTGQQGCGRLLNEGGLELGGRDHSQFPV